MFSGITSDKHVPLKSFGGHGKVHFFGPQKGRDAHPYPSIVTSFDFRMQEV